MIVVGNQEGIPMHQSMSSLNIACKSYKDSMLIGMWPPETTQEHDVKMADILKPNMYVCCAKNLGCSWF